MAITEEDFKKMFDLVRELHENYTKNIERENENLRNMLAEAQRRLDEALATIEKLKSGNNEEVYKRWREIQDRMGENQKIWTSPATTPYDPNYPVITWTSNNTTNPYMTSRQSVGSPTQIDITKEYESLWKKYRSSMMYSKADEDG